MSSTTSECAEYAKLLANMQETHLKHKTGIDIVAVTLGTSGFANAKFAIDSHIVQTAGIACVRSEIRRISEDVLDKS